jgi:hypothetical protein
MVEVLYKTRGQIVVTSVVIGGKTCYKFKCGWCRQKPLFGNKFRKHLVAEHNVKDGKALRMIDGAAKDYKERRTGYEYSAK